MPAFFLAGQLVFEVHSGSAGLDHAFHQLEGVERSAEAGLGVGHDGQKVVAVRPAFHVLYLVGAAQRVVDPSHDVGHAIGRVQTLVGIHLSGVIGVGGHLPSTQINGRQAGLGHLHGLVSGQRAQGVDVGLECDEFPQFFRPAPGQRVLDVQAAAQPHDVVGRVVAAHAFPTRVIGPFTFELCRGAITRHGAHKPF